MTGHCCKVGRIVDAYDLPAVDDELQERWTRADDPDSLRTLKRFVNRRVLQAAMEAADMEILDGEVENAHRLLTDDEVSSGMRTRVRQRLKRNGVDVDRVESSFVSHPTIGSHLTDCLGAEREGTDTGSSEGAERIETRIFKMQNRTEVVTRDALEQLRTAGRIDTGDLTVLVDVQVMCGQCGAQYPVREFLDDGGCGCS